MILIVGATLSGIDLSGRDLTGVSISQNAVSMRADFQRANLTGALMIQATFMRSRPDGKPGPERSDHRDTTDLDRRPARWRHSGPVRLPQCRLDDVDWPPRAASRHVCRDRSQPDAPAGAGRVARALRVRRPHAQEARFPAAAISHPLRLSSGQLLEGSSLARTRDQGDELPARPA